MKGGLGCKIALRFPKVCAHAGMFNVNQKGEVPMRIAATTRGLGGLAVIATIAGALALSNTAAFAQQKTAKQCADEWRANKADNQAKGISEKAYVTQCRAGGAAATPAAAPAEPAKPAATPAAGTQKTAKQCAEEWRANKADNQAKGITEKSYVTDCRAGRTAAAPAAAPAEPAKPAAAPAEPARPAAAPAPAPAPKATGTTAVAPAGQFANEALAKARCPTDTVVWVNEESKIYHFSGHKDYGNTKEGKYMCEKDAIAAGDRAAKNEKHP